MHPLAEVQRVAEIPKSDVFERWVEKVKGWKDVQSVLNWLQGDPDLFDVVMKMARKEVSFEDALDQYEASLVKRGETDTAARLKRLRSERLTQ